MIARRILTVATAAAILWRATGRTEPDEPTREYELVDLDEPRASRQIHGLTAPELAAERAAEDQARAWEWARITQDLSCDADFRNLARRLGDQFPDS